MRTILASKVNDGLFLPDFCNIHSILLVGMFGELLAVILTLTAGNDLEMSLDYLLKVSIFIQWVVIACCVSLCLLRPWLRRLSSRNAALAAFVVTLLIVTLISWCGLWAIGYRQGGVLEGSIVPQHFVLSNITITAIVSALALRYFYVQYHWKRQIQAQSEAKVQALQSRIRPHFLFNSMNIIASLTRSKPHLAEQAVEDLSDLFRASLSGNDNHTTWEKELTLARQYLRIESLRLGDRLKVNWSIETLPGNALLPALTLQPLLENAIGHGIEPLPEGGEILIKGNRAGNQLSILITNPLNTSSVSNGKEGNQIAQDNVRERLSLFFNDKAILRIKPGKDNYSVNLTFPYKVTL